ncbi:MAG: hypothetical protein U0353_18605 [Sandaracinus sp.]
MKMGDGGFDLPTTCSTRPTRVAVIVGVAVTNVGSIEADGADAGEIEQRTCGRAVVTVARTSKRSTMEQRGVACAPVRKQRSNRPACAQAWRQRRGSALACADGDDDSARSKATRLGGQTINADQRHWRPDDRARLVGQTKVLAQTRMGVLLQRVASPRAA